MHTSTHSAHARVRSTSSPCTRRHPLLAELAQAAADEAESLGHDHFAQEEWEEAYRFYSQALAVDPSRSWTRRKAEDARDYWLRIVRPGRTKDDLPDRRLTSDRKKDDAGAKKTSDKAED